MTIARPPFDPAAHLTKISGNPYLEVAWALVWLRSEHPDAAIKTDLVQDTGAGATFRAEVTIPGGGSATGWGSETYEDFTDYLEKAESKAIRRALHALGYSAEFCAPTEAFSAKSAEAGQQRRAGGRKPTPRPAQANVARSVPDQAAAPDGAEPPTDQQIAAIRKLTERLEMPEAEAAAYFVPGSRAEAGRIIQQLQSQVPATAGRR